MPTYEYVCKKCGKELEVFQKMTDPKLEKCPACGKNALQRKIGSGAGIIFRGTGLIAGPPTLQDSPGFVTFPTPIPPQISTLSSNCSTDAV